MPSNFLGIQSRPREHEATSGPIGFRFSRVWDRQVQETNRSGSSSHVLGPRRLSNVMGPKLLAIALLSSSCGP
jgi:hypothetical protein